MNMNNQMNNNNLMNMNNQMNMNWLDQYNMNNNMNMNFTPLNLNNQNMNDIKDDTLKELNIIYHYKKMVFNELSNCNEMAKKVIKRFCNKLGLNYKSLKFIFNAKMLLPYLTVAEAGITNMSNIFVTESKPVKIKKDSDSDDNEKNNTFPILFKTPVKKEIKVFVNPELSVGTALKKYLIQIGKAELIHSLKKGNNELMFIQHGKKIDINEERKVKDFLYANQTIVVVRIDSICGA